MQHLMWFINILFWINVSIKPQNAACGLQQHSTQRRPPGALSIIHSVLLLHKETASTATESREVKSKKKKRTSNPQTCKGHCEFSYNPGFYYRIQTSPSSPERRSQPHNLNQNTRERERERSLLNQNWIRPPAGSLVRFRERKKRWTSKKQKVKTHL